MGTSVSPSVKARTDTSGPVRNSSMTTRSPLRPNFLSTIMASMAAAASSLLWAMMTPLPRASPSALMTMGISQLSR